MRNLRSISLRPVAPLLALLVVASGAVAAPAGASPATRDDVERGRLALEHVQAEADSAALILRRTGTRLRDAGHELDALRAERRAARAAHGARSAEVRTIDRRLRRLEARRDALAARALEQRVRVLVAARARATVLAGLDLATRQRIQRAARARDAADPLERFLLAVAVEPTAADPLRAVTRLAGHAAPEPSRVGAAAAAYALTQVGVPYRAAGASPAGYDCSGLIYWSFAQLGVAIPRSSGDIWAAGEPVPVDRLEPGDIVSFHGQGHVGIYLGDGLYVHSTESGDVVSVDPIDRRDDLDGAVRLPA